MRAPPRAVLAAFADLLAYPRGTDAARACLAVLDGPAAEALRGFAGFAERAGTAGLEELYTSTFDLAPSCPPYLGHHLCRDPSQRGVFLLRLSEVYAAEGFRASDLPDHVSEVLRFLAAAGDEEARQVLLRDALLPAVERMARPLRESANPYAAVLEALLACLAPQQEAEARP